MVIVCKNGKEFREVAAYYKWDLFHDEVDRTPSSIYINKEGKPSGWDRNTAVRSDKKVSFEEWAQKVGYKIKESKVNTMKYCVEVENQEEANAVLTKLGQTPYKLSSFPRVVTSGGLQGELSYHKRDTVIASYGPTVSFKHWALTMDVQLKPNKTLKLTNDYNAVVNYAEKVVQVGCQTIPFETVQKLAKLTQE